MDFKKVFHQAVREIKREVNLKVLNVPEIEQQVLDATSDEPWGPHGSDLSDIAAATKASFLECDLVMSVLWQRLSNTKANWLHLYKALVVIEYLVANGSERAVDDVYDNISQITALSSFEFVEPNGKDVGLSVRKKSDAILSLFDDREKLQEVREKATATRDKYIGLSSTGLSHKPSSASFGSGYYDSTNKYGSTNSPKEADLFISNRETNSYSSGVRNHQQPKEKVTQRSPKSTLKDVSDDDFDPRAATTNSASADKSAESMDISVPNLMDDIFDTPTSTPNLNAATKDVQGEVDLFADSAFQSVTSNSKETSVQDTIDLFANITSESKPNDSSISNTKTDNSFDPCSAIPSKNHTAETEFEFGTFTSSGTEKFHEKPKAKDGAPQVKSGIWADSLSRGLIDLDIAAPKKISLADKKDSALRQNQFATPK